MKIENSSQAAALIGLINTAVAAILLGVLYVAYGSIFPAWCLAIVPAGVFLCSYLIAWLIIDKIIVAKINVIYRIIQGSDKSKTSTPKATPAISQVKDEVLAWSSVKHEEILSLRQEARFRREFIGNLAHELRTPIFNMQGYLDTLIEGGLEDPKINYDYLNRADKNLERLTALVKDMDEIANIEAGRESMKVERINILDLVEGVFSLMEIRAKEKKINLRFDKEYDRPIWVKADREKLIRVFSNLILNAIYYGHKKGYCEIQFTEMSGKMLVEVKDNGIGIAEIDLPRLFERFYRVDKSRSRNEGGTGLGLAIVKHIIESHGQTINVHSTLNEGTTFSFTLDKA